MRETSIKEGALRMLKKEFPSTFVFKPADRWRSGIPDLLLCMPKVIGGQVYGLFVAIELKVPGKKAEPIQEWTLSEIRKAGGRTAVCHSVAEVREFLTEILN